MWRRRRLWLEDTKLERNEELKHPCCHEWEPAGVRLPRFHCGKPWNHLLAGWKLFKLHNNWRNLVSEVALSSDLPSHASHLSWCETGMSRRADCLVWVIWQSRFPKLHQDLILTVWARCPVLEATFINAIKSPTGNLTGVWKCEGIQVEKGNEGRWGFTTATRRINHSDILVLSSSSSPRTDFHRSYVTMATIKVEKFLWWWWRHTFTDKIELILSAKVKNLHAELRRRHQRGIMLFLFTS